MIPNFILIAGLGRIQSGNHFFFNLKTIKISVTWGGGGGGGGGGVRGLNSYYALSQDLMMSEKLAAS